MLWVTLDGDCDLREAIRMVDLYKALGELQPYYILADSRDAGRLEPEARRQLSENMRAAWVQEIVFYNTRLVHRAMAKGLILAAELFHAVNSPMRGRLHFVSTQARARALLEELRERRGAGWALGARPG